MRYIQKGQEPESFTAWKAEANEKWQPTWENFSDDRNNPKRRIRTEVHESLLQEQGYLCCYCGMTITKDFHDDEIQALIQGTTDTVELKVVPSHIEHFIPRSVNPALALNYTNLLASCGSSKQQYNKIEIVSYCREHCAQRRRNLPLSVSPLQLDCEKYFKYLGSGEVEPTNDLTRQADAQAMIDTLNLNYSRLVAMREKAIDAALQDLQDFEELTNDEIQAICHGYRQPDAEGKLIPFCAVVIYTLEQYTSSGS